MGPGAEVPRGGRTGAEEAEMLQDGCTRGRGGRSELKDVEQYGALWPK